jgi:sodium-dependent dicarboxylate transporter 2/3/5
MNQKQRITAIGFSIFATILISTKCESTFWNAIALSFLMIFFWVFEVIPIYVTALFPLVLAIPMGVLNKEDLAMAYGDGNVFLFFGGFLLALGLEKWNVHEQIARGIIAAVGQSPSRILFGFIMSTGLISMWISNTATALMMLPMALAIIEALPKKDQKGKFAIFLMLSVAYASSIGGVGTLVGSPPNTQMASILEKQFHTEVDFFTWMKIGFPVAILMLLVLFLMFYSSLRKEKNLGSHQLQLPNAPWTKDQFKVLAIFSGVVMLWILKDVIHNLTGFTYRDENVAMLGGALLFLIPSQEKKTLLKWEDTKQLPWGILLLFGGGLALAAIMEKNGMIESISVAFSQMNTVSYFGILLTVVTIAVFASEVLSNLAMVVIFVPIVAGFANQLGIPILQLAIPLTLGASLAFMLPVGTPPNAIVFSSGYLKVKDMVKYGLVLNLIGIGIIVLLSWILL